LPRPAHPTARPLRASTAECWRPESGCRQASTRRHLSARHTARPRSSWCSKPRAARWRGRASAQRFSRSMEDASQNVVTALVDEVASLAVVLFHQFFHWLFQWLGLRGRLPALFLLWLGVLVWLKQHSQSAAQMFQVLAHHLGALLCLG